MTAKTVRASVLKLLSTTEGLSLKHTAVTKYIVIVVDYVSKWPEANALPNQEAVTVADVLVSQFSTLTKVEASSLLFFLRRSEDSLEQNNCPVSHSEGMVER